MWFWIRLRTILNICGISLNKFFMDSFWQRDVTLHAVKVQPQQQQLTETTCSTLKLSNALARIKHQRHTQTPRTNLMPIQVCTHLFIIIQDMRSLGNVIRVKDRFKKLAAIKIISVLCKEKKKQRKDRLHFKETVCAVSPSLSLQSKVRGMEIQKIAHFQK